MNNEETKSIGNFADDAVDGSEIKGGHKPLMPPGPLPIPDNTNTGALPDPEPVLFGDGGGIQADPGPSDPVVMADPGMVVQP